MSSPSITTQPGVRSPLSPSSAANGTTPARTGALVPTNNVTTKEGVTVRARIDPTLTVDDVVRQLCINLKIQDGHANFALRDENDELVTNDNLRKKIKTKINLKWVIVHLCVSCIIVSFGMIRLVNSPALEAKETAERLTLRDERTFKMTLFSLQKYIRVCYLTLELYCTINELRNRRNNLHKNSSCTMG